MSGDLDDMAALWQEYHAAQRERRVARLPVRTAEILALVELGYRVERKTAYHFRIDGALDLFPTHRRYHDLKRNRRGSYVTPQSIALRILPRERA